MQHKDQLGFLTFALNNDSTNYLDMAYLQALNIKATQKNNKFAVIVNKKTNQLITDQHKKVFDHIIEIPKDFENPFEAESKVFWLTPFKETIKLEADLLLPRSIDHWINIFRLRDVVLSHGTKDYFQQNSSSRKYRKFFDDNDLPDLYNGLMYFRFSKIAADFFRTASLVFENWNTIKTELKNCREDIPSTDVVYAITAKVIGSELCHIPSADFINFVHMKPSINNFGEDYGFTEVFLFEWKEYFRINNINQYHPLHYHDKNFPVKELIDYYEQRIME